MKQKIKIEVDVPEGYEFVRYGLPQKGESYLCNGLVIQECFHSTQCESYLIVRKAAAWKDAAIQDLETAPRECRFRFSEGDWGFGVLCGIQKMDMNSRDWLVLPSYSDVLFPVRNCQVKVED